MASKNFLLPIGLTAFSALSLAQNASKPVNVIFFMADDLGWTDLGCYGSKFYETPNLDQLAKEGIRFTNAYASCPVSSPSRASFQTGKYPTRVGITDYIPGRYNLPKGRAEIQKTCPFLPPDIVLNMPLEEVTIGEMLQKNGYKTAHIGKWHLSEDSTYFPQFQGYDINIAGNSKGSPSYEGGGYFLPYNNPNLKDGPKGEYLTDRLGDECVKIIQQYQNDPFFISFPFYQVHTPLMGKPDKVKYFQEKAHQMGLDTIKYIYDENPEWKAKQPFKQNGFHERMIQSNPVFAAMIASMDENLGKVIAELKRLGLYDNTIIVFTSDNGGLSTAESSPTSNKPLRAGKGFMYEGGIRVPLIAKWKGHFPENKTSENIVSTIDYFPTLLDLLDINKPDSLLIDGISVKSSFEGKNQNRGSIFWHYPHYPNQGGRLAGAIREGDYKLIEFFDNNTVELYNIKKDISEKHDLSKIDTERTATMLKKLQDWRVSVKAKMPINDLKNFQKQ